MRLVCVEHLTSPRDIESCFQSPPPPPPPRQHSREGPDKPVSPGQLSLCQLRAERLLLLCLASLPPDLRSSVHPCNHIATHFHSFDSIIMCLLLPGAVQVPREAAFLEPHRVGQGILCRKQEIMGKVNRSGLCVTIYPALSAYWTLFLLLIVSFNTQTFS